VQDEKAGTKFDISELELQPYVREDKLVKVSWPYKGMRNPAIKPKPLYFNPKILSVGCFKVMVHLVAI